MTGHVYKKSKRTTTDVHEERVIMNEGDACSTATESEHGSDRAVHPIRPPIARNLRKAMEKLIQSNIFNVFIVALVIFNWLIVIMELLINLRIFELGHPVGVKRISNALHIVNVAILGVFVVEMWLKLIVFGRRFFKLKMEIFDFIIVVLAFSLILAFGGKENSADSAGLLVVMRLWRVSKIINSMIAVVKHEAERKMVKERRSLRALEREVCKLREYCLQQDCELHTYRAILHQNCIPLPTVIRAPAAPRTLNVIAEVNEVELQQKQMAIDEYKIPPTMKDKICEQQHEFIIGERTIVAGGDFDQPPKYSDEMACGHQHYPHVEFNTLPRHSKNFTTVVVRRCSGDECSTV